MENAGIIRELDSTDLQKSIGNFIQRPEEVNLGLFHFSLENIFLVLVNIEPIIDIKFNYQSTFKWNSWVT